MNTIKFQNSLDKLLADGQLANTNESFNTIMVINSSDAALLDFDTFKGSYLALSHGSYLDILPNNSLTIGSTRSTINIYFNLQQVHGNHSILQFEIDNSLFEITILIDNQDTSIKYLCLAVPYVEDGLTYNRFINTHIPVNLDYWHNLNINIYTTGEIHISVNNVEQVFTYSYPQVILDPEISFVELRKLRLGSSDGGIQVGFADIYIFENIDEVSLQCHIDTALNEAILFDLNQKISFRLYSEFEGRRFLGLIKGHNDQSIIYKLKIVKKPNIALLPTLGTAQLQLKIKKGIISPVSLNSHFDGDNPDYDYFDITTDANVDEFIIPDLEIINVTAQEECLTHLVLQGFTVYENNIPVKRNSFIHLDYLTNIYDCSLEQTNSTSPFELHIIGNDTLFNYENNSNSITIELTNKSGELLNFKHNSNINSSSSFEWNSPYWIHLLDTQNLRSLSAICYTQQNNDWIANSAFGSEVNLHTSQFIIKSIQSFSLGNQEVLRIKISGIKVKKASSSYPSGIYPFSLKYNNIIDTPSNYLNFKLRFGDTETRNSDNSDSCIDTLNADILKLKSSIQFIQSQLEMVSAGNKLSIKNGQSTLIDIEQDKIKFHVDPYFKNALMYMPIGSIVAFAGNQAPYGWLLCDGSNINNNVYTQLRNILGRNNIPDLRGKFILGMDNTRTMYASHTVSGMFHLVNNESLKPLGTATSTAKDNKMSGGTGSVSTNITSPNTAQSYYVLTYIIKYI